MNKPLVSVIMSVHNGDAYVAKAIESILKQSWRNLEFLITDDASTDGTPALLASLQDEQIRVITNHNTRGLAANLNRMLMQCRGEYIARMDADDISEPGRLLKQVRFMQKYPETGISGTWARDADSGIVYRSPAKPEAIKVRLLAGPGLFHPTVMFRKTLLEKHGLLYDETLPVAQDYDLWVRASQCFAIRNLAEPLLRYRKHNAQASSIKRTEQDTVADTIRLKQLQELLPDLTAQEIEPYQRMVKGQSSLQDFENGSLDILIANIIQAASTSRTGYYDTGELKKFLGYLRQSALEQIFLSMPFDKISSERYRRLSHYPLYRAYAAPRFIRRWKSAWEQN